jgi:voltage-gated potassium channel
MTTVGYGDHYPVTAAGRLVAFGLMIGGIALLGTVTATLASWLVETVAAEKEQADDLQVTVRRLEDKIDRLAAGSERGLAQADRAQDLLLEEAADHDQDQAHGEPDDHGDETGIGHE